MDKHLHIISLTVPYPVDYGGVFDLFYKLPSLHQCGVKIHLHCFDYGRGEQPLLEKYCASVHYYQRGRKKFSGSLPHIVVSRKNETMLNRLLEDEYPILMEGIHCSYLLTDFRFSRRQKFVRLHNVEFEYYRDLSRATNHPLKKLYFLWESQQLKKFESHYCNAARFIAVSQKDVITYQREFNCDSISYLPLFLPPWKMAAKAGVGTYCLYQGDLSVPSNERIAYWLIKRVFASLQIPFKIAGKRPSYRLHQLAARFENIQVIADPDEATMQTLIAEAHVNVIPSLSATGIKLKLLNALYNGRHCVVNHATVAGTGLESLCQVAESAAHMKGLISQLYHQPFRNEELREREATLQLQFNNEVNGQKLTQVIFNDA